MNKNIVIGILVIAVTVLGVLYFVRDETSAPSPNETNSTSNSQSTPSTRGKVLDYSNQGLTEFPKDALNDTSVVELNLSGNNLTGALPSEIGKLVKLEILNVSDNPMTGIPAEIGQLSKLRILNYADNQITGLPNELGKLQNLELFDLSGNNPSQQDLNGIKADLPSTTVIIL